MFLLSLSVIVFLLITSVAVTKWKKTSKNVKNATVIRNIVYHTMEQE